MQKALGRLARHVRGAYVRTVVEDIVLLRFLEALALFELVVLRRADEPRACMRV